MAQWTSGISFALPSAWNGSYSWGSRAHTHDPLATSLNGQRQYCVWVDNNRRGRIAKRTHGQGWGASVDLFAVAGSALNQLFTEDEHCAIVVGIDPNERIHVAGNMHNDPLRYMRSSAGGDISTWSSPAMVGAQEDSVTYPVFFNLLNGTLMFLYRNGLAGTTGNTYLNSYNHGTDTWSRVATIWDDAGNITFYPHHVAVDQSSGVIHLIGTKRHSTTGNSDIVYIKSANGGTTWTKADGTAVTMPLNDTRGDIILDSPVTLQSPLNNGGLELDSSGRPHSVFLINDGTGSKTHHVWHNGTSWQNDQILPFSVGRASVVCKDSGAVAVIGRASAGGRTNVIRVWDIVNGVVDNEYALNTPLMGVWEPAIDTRALYLRNEVWLVAGPGDGSGDTAYQNQLNVPVMLVEEVASIMNVQDIKADKLNQEYSVTFPAENNVGALLQRYRDDNNLERWEDYMAHIASASILDLPGSAGAFASTPDHASLDITGNLVLIADVAMDVWASGATQTIIAKLVGSGSQQSYTIRLTATGGLQVLITSDGSTGLSFNGPNLAANANTQRMAVRADIVPNNGASQRQVTFYTAPTKAGPWVQAGAPVVQAGAVTIFSGTAPLEVGTFNNGVSAPMAGQVFAAEVISDTYDTGTVVASPDFESQTPGVTSFADSTGKTWTVSGAAVLAEVFGTEADDEPKFWEAYVPTP